MSVLIHFDGLCEPNPGGITTFGFVIERDGRVLEESYGPAAKPGTPEATNNVAEYTGVIRALERAKDLGFSKEAIVVRGDSQLVIHQINGEWRVRDKKIARLYVQAIALRDEFANIRFEWVQRERNKRADWLSNQAYVRELARQS